MPKANRIGDCYLLLGIFAWISLASAQRRVTTPLFQTGTSNTHSLRWHGEIKPGRRDVFVSSLDLSSTSLATVQIDFAGAPGINLLSNPKELAPLPRNRAIFGEIYPGDATVLDDASKEIVYRWIWQGDYKLMAPNSSISWNDYLHTVHLYDLETHPSETVNLTEEPKYRMIRHKLREQLDAWWRP